MATYASVAAVGPSIRELALAFEERTDPTKPLWSLVRSHRRPRLTLDTVINVPVSTWFWIASDFANNKARGIKKAFVNGWRFIKADTKEYWNMRRRRAQWWRGEIARKNY